MGARGGWSWTLTTQNLMKDNYPQKSLTEDLQRGAALAHRQVVHGGPEFRNFRRTLPLQLDNVKK